MAQSHVYFVSQSQPRMRTATGHHDDQRQPSAGDGTHSSNVSISKHQAQQVLSSSNDWTYASHPLVIRLFSPNLRIFSLKKVPFDTQRKVISKTNEAIQHHSIASPGWPSGVLYQDRLREVSSQAKK